MNKDNLPYVFSVFFSVFVYYVLVERGGGGGGGGGVLHT